MARGSTPPSRPTQAHSRGASPAETTSQFVRQREQLSPDASEPIPIVTSRSRSWSPLLYRKRLLNTGSARAGDLVAIYVEGLAQPTGYGLFNPRSELAVRQLWTTPELPTDAPGDKDWQRQCRCVATCCNWIVCRTHGAWSMLRRMDCPDSSSIGSMTCCRLSASVSACTREPRFCCRCWPS